MAEDWYVSTPETLKYSGFEKDGYDDSVNQFEGALKYAINAHDIHVLRYVKDGEPIVEIDTRVLITSNVESRQDIKQVTYRKGELQIGDLYVYQEETYILSKWENRDIVTYDNIESVICNTVATVTTVVETTNGTDKFDKEIIVKTETEHIVPCYYNAKADAYDDDKLINLPIYKNEIWVQYREYYEVDVSVSTYGEPYKIIDIDRTYTKLDGSGNIYGMLRISLETTK